MGDIEALTKSRVYLAVGKPIFLFLAWRYVKNTVYAEQVEGALAEPATIGRITRMTLFIGIVSVVDAVL